MRRVVYVVAVLISSLAMGGVATEQNVRSALEYYATIKDPVQRLAAYDELARIVRKEMKDAGLKIAGDEEAEDDAPAVRKFGKWEYEAKAAADGEGMVYTLCLYSENELGVEGDTYKPYMLIMCVDGKLRLGVVFLEKVGVGSARVITRLDRREAVVSKWNVGKDGMDITLAVDPDNSIKAMMKAKTLYLRVTPSREKSLSVTFDVRELAKGIDVMLTAALKD